MSTSYAGSPCYPLNTSHIGKLAEYNLSRSWNTIPFEVYCILIALVGAIGNSLVICIFKRKTNKSSATYFILTLAAIDLCVCLTVIPFSVVNEAFLKYTWAEQTVCKIFEWFKHSSLSISCLTLAFIAIDRYIAICHPLSVFVSHGRVKLMMIVVSFVLGAGVQSQTLVFFGVRTTRVDDNLLGCRCDFQDAYNRTSLHTYFIAYLMTGYCLLLITIVVCYTLVWLTIRKRHIDRQKQQQGSFTYTNTVQAESSNGDIGNAYCWCCSKRKIIPETVPDASKWATQMATPGTSSQGESQQGVGTQDIVRINNSGKKDTIQGKHTNDGIENDKHLNKSGGSLAKVVWDEHDIIEDGDGKLPDDLVNDTDMTLHKISSTERIAGVTNSPHQNRKARLVSLVVPSVHGLPQQILDPNKGNSTEEGKGIKTKRVSFESNSSGKLSLGHLSNDISSGSDEQGDDGRRQIRQFLNRMESVHSIDFRNHFLPRVQEMESAGRESNAETVKNIEESTENLQCSMRCFSINRSASARVSNQGPGAHLDQSVQRKEKIVSFRLCCTSNSQSKTLHMSASMRAALSSFQQARYKTARLLLIVTVVFLLTWLPFWVVMIYGYVDEDLWYKANPVKLNFLLIGRHFYFINSMTNPFIYVFMNKHFRDDVKKMYGPRCRRLKKVFCCKKQPD